MARVNVTQNINLTIVVDGATQVLPLLRDRINDVPNHVLTHPYLQAHMKAGSVSIVPDPMDPEDIAAAAEEIARQARGRAEAAKALKLEEQKKIDDAMAAAEKPAAPAADPAKLEDAGKRDEEEEFQQLLQAEADAAAAAASAA